MAQHINIMPSKTKHHTRHPILTTDIPNNTPDIPLIYNHTENIHIYNNHIDKTNKLACILLAHQQTNKRDSIHTLSRHTTQTLQIIGPSLRKHVRTRTHMHRADKKKQKHKDNPCHTGSQYLQAHNKTSCHLNKIQKYKSVRKLHVPHKRQQ